MTPPRRTRAYLAVPAHRGRLVQHAAASAADAVFMDLEDAVPPAEKTAALQAAQAALRDLDWGHKTVSVRLNTIDSGRIEQEIAGLCGLQRLDAVIIPKAEMAADLTKIAGWIKAAQGSRPTPVEIELLIETARGLVNVETLAAQPMVTALHLGVGDLAASLGARTTEVGISPATYKHVGSAAEGYPMVPLDYFAYPMMRMLVAARAFGLRAIDGPCSAFKDATVTGATAVKAAAMGFDGKQVIHPSQIEATRDAFIPSAEEVAYARRVATALDDAAREGKGAVTVDGRMIDIANARMVERILRMADAG